MILKPEEIAKIEGVVAEVNTIALAHHTGASKEYGGLYRDVCFVDDGSTTGGATIYKKADFKPKHESRCAASYIYTLRLGKHEQQIEVIFMQYRRVGLWLDKPTEQIEAHKLGFIVDICRGVDDELSDYLDRGDQIGFFGIHETGDVTLNNDIACTAEQWTNGKGLTLIRECLATNLKAYGAVPGEPQLIQRDRWQHLHTMNTPIARGKGEQYVYAIDASGGAESPAFIYAPFRYVYMNVVGTCHEDVLEDVWWDGYFGFGYGFWQRCVRMKIVK